MSCNCCVFKSIQNCNLLFHRPFTHILWDEKLINIRHVENDIKVYWFYRGLFERNSIFKLKYNEWYPTLLLGDRLQPLAHYYIYCYGYRIRYTGEREISVGVIDWMGRAFVTAEIVCGVYPRTVKTRGQKYINLKPMRNSVGIRACTTLKESYDSNTARPHIEAILDQVVSVFIHDYAYHEDRIQQTVLERVGACLSIRLTQFLKYAIHLQKTVKHFCQSNCTCGDFCEECTCPIPYSCSKVFTDAKRLCSDEVLFGAPLP